MVRVRVTVGVWVRDRVGVRVRVRDRVGVVLTRAMLYMTRSAQPQLPSQHGTDRCSGVVMHGAVEMPQVA